MSANPPRVLALTAEQSVLVDKLAARLSTLDEKAPEVARQLVEASIVKRGLEGLESELNAREGAPRPIQMREACKTCFTREGVVVQKGGQDTVRCKKCDRHCYNAPRTETGREKRSVSTVRDGLKPKHRAAILERATGRCEFCGSRGGQQGLQVGHLVSVDSGFAHGLTDDEINSEENLCALCEACNLGMGKRSLPLRLAVAMVLVRIKEARKGT